MTQSAAKIRISNPCHEDWQHMQPSKNGRFCAACDKDVRDFTQASNAEILQAYREQHGNVCGRFRREQVNDAYPLRLKQLKRFLCAAILAFGAFLFALDVGAQQAVRQVQEAVLPDTVAPAVTNGMKVFRGTVKDGDSGEVLPFANVVLNAGGKEHGTVTDFDGNYRITVPDSLATKGDMIMKVTFIGYAPSEITYQADADKALTIELVEMEVITLGGFTMGGYVPEVQEVTKTRFNPELSGETVFGREEVRRAAR